jgi:hypothetical protein
VKSAYDYCEELTRREAGNFYHSFKYLPEEERAIEAIARILRYGAPGTAGAEADVEADASASGGGSEDVEVEDNVDVDIEV